MSKQEAESWVAPHPPGGGACYRVLLWQTHAVCQQAFSVYKHEREAIVVRMRDAGARGARGVLAEAQRQLQNLNRICAWASCVRRYGQTPGC